ncbi:hypothetical protein ANCDUO_00464 [Ancylostoma duodenale]|uniref:Uncharacterized protein n=1 Tax=Ancylostoma duodenale TaxID=51022 RepID=A0A0C2E1G1_9BILA|nr:hypothetical protein ANCDUO_00464 [Ancylostoma duodenale]
MFEKFLLCLVIVIAIISFVSADFSCFFGDTICKSITCRKLKQGTYLRFKNKSKINLNQK